MNVTALLDAPVRTPTPLDQSVGEEAPDPAFANVMSQYHGDGNKSLASGVQSDAANPTDVASTDAPSANEVTTPLDPVESDGQTLPLPPTIDGQPLPLVGLVTAQLPTLHDPADPLHPLDATDASAAAAMIGAAPLPPVPVATTNGVPVVASAVAADTAADVVDAPRAQLGTAAAPIVDAATTDAEAPAPIPPVDPRAIKKNPDATATTQTTTAAPADDLAPRSGSVAHTQALRAFGLGHLQMTTDGSALPQSEVARQRDLKGSSADPLRGEGGPKIANAHLALALEAAGQKDPALLQKEGGTDPIRTDALSPRTGALVDASRDAASTRLNDLAQQHAPRFAAELADRVLVLRSQRFDSATVSLEPRELGRIDIQVRLQADGTHIAFTTQHAVVKDALEGQMPRLRAMLEEAGLSLGNVDVAHSGSRGAGDSGTARSFAGSQSVTAADPEKVDASPRWQHRAETSLIDLHA